MFNKEKEKQIEKRLNYSFKNKELLFRAFTHSSYANLNNLTSNERLEFLGDSVLHFATTNFLYNKLNLSEGRSSKLRAYVVSTTNLANSTKQMKLAEFVLFGKDEKVALSNSIKADLFESILGAIYLDSDFETAKNWIYETLNYSEELFEQLLKNLNDYKTILQELIQKNPKNKLTYEIVEKTGKPHMPQFKAVCKLNGKTIGEGLGKTKKEAQNYSAKMAIEVLS